MKALINNMDDSSWMSKNENARSSTLDKFGDSSGSVFRGVCECQLVYETLL